MSGEYRYVIEGKSGGGQDWSTSGPVSGDFPEVLTAAMRASFQQLTNGRAVFGSPGAGCRGPYTVTKFTLEKAAQ